MEDIGLWGVPLAILAGAIRVSTPFIFVSLGEAITERSGRINLGLEGTLVFGAMTAYGVAVLTLSPGLGVLAAMAAGAVFGLSHGYTKVASTISRIAESSVGSSESGLTTATSHARRRSIPLAINCPAATRSRVLGTSARPRS